MLRRDFPRQRSSTAIASHLTDLGVALHWEKRNPRLAAQVRQCARTTPDHLTPLDVMTHGELLRNIAKTANRSRMHDHLQGQFSHSAEHAHFMAAMIVDALRGDLADRGEV